MWPLKTGFTVLSMTRVILFLFLFQVGDLISIADPNPCTCLNRTYKLVLDKGTYDAISLKPEDPMAARCAYKTIVKRLMDKDSLFSLTSCNWIKDELIAFFQDGMFVFIPPVRST